MDWRNRKYYCVKFHWLSHNMRLDILKNIYGIKLRPYKEVPKQPDELEERYFYNYMISIPSDCAEDVEYELRKAERRDGFCEWKEIKENKKVLLGGTHEI